mmetsp:Transcript_27404/g.68753  ORF Transcript_27404/g.68753 Transcript_27404/m.68753 type:complete len:205 (+) Transcript_27404:1428-2042(+)
MILHRQCSVGFGNDRRVRPSWYTKYVKTRRFLQFVLCSGTLSTRIRFPFLHLEAEFTRTFILMLKEEVQDVLKRNEGSRVFPAPHRTQTKHLDVGWGRYHEIRENACQVLVDKECFLLKNFVDIDVIWTGLGVRENYQCSHPEGRPKNCCRGTKGCLRNTRLVKTVNKDEACERTIRGVLNLKRNLFSLHHIVKSACIKHPERG